MTIHDIPIEVVVATDATERPHPTPSSIVDVSVGGRMYPTARLEDGRYAAWWFDADAPPLDDPVTTEWVVAPTRYLAAVTLSELWENPAAFDALTSGGTAPQFGP